MLVIKRSRLFAGLFSEVVARSKTNACLDQVVKTIYWFFSEIVTRSRTNVCPNQVVKTVYFFPNQEHLDDYNLIYFAP
jgi:hypothetical protein